jgi:hypothetical protein
MKDDLKKNVQLSIRDFMDENNIKYKTDYFKEYEYESVHANK